MSASHRSLNDKHIDAAGYALKELKKMGDVNDAQISMALMTAYLCNQNEIAMDNYVKMLIMNVKGIESNPEFSQRVVAQIHKAMNPSIISVPKSYIPKTIN